MPEHPAVQSPIDRSLRRRVSLNRTILAVGFASLLFPILSIAEQPASAFLLRRGAIVDPGRGAAYVSRPSGTIDAVDLASGRTLWTSNDAAVPLGVDDSLLIAQFEETPRAAERLRVVVLDAAGGGKVSEASITLPAGVRGLVNDERGRSLRVTAEREGALFLISWYYQETMLGGAASEDDEQPATRAFAGSARIEPRTGRIVNGSGDPVTHARGRWRTHGAPPQQPLQTGSVSARTEGGRGGPLVLKRTNAASGQALPDQLLSNRGLVSVASFDSRHLLVSERAAEGGPNDPEYRWLIFAMDTAERATELRRDVSSAPFFVFDDSVILESRPHGYLRGDVRVDEPLQLQAFRLSTGVAKWNVELRDLSYRGPQPLRPLEVVR